MPIQGSLLGRSRKIANLPLTIVHGDTFRRRLTLKTRTTTQPEDLTGWTAGIDHEGRAVWTRPLDLTGCSFAAQIRGYDDTTLATITVTVIDADGGIIELLIAAVTTAGLPVTTGRSPVWDLQITKADGDIWTPVGGKVEIDADVTHP